MAGRTCKRFQGTMERIARMAGVDLYEGAGASVKVSVKGFEPLVIENIGMGQIAVGHFYLQNGDVMYDPEVTFLVTEEGWIPMTYQQDDLGVYQVVAKAADGRLTHIAKKGQADLVRFVNQWGRNINLQGFTDPSLVQIERAERSWAAREKAQAA